MKDQNMVLAIQSFGRESEYRRAALTVLSFYAFIDQNDAPVLLFTDQPDWFASRFKGFNISYSILTPEKIKTMRGDIDFLHRMKIAVIEETFHTYPKHKILYADSDTFFFKNPLALLQKVNEQTSCMHVWEYKFHSMKEFELPAGQTFQDFYKLITHQNFTLHNGNTITISPEMVSWNAGVMFFDSSHVRFIPDVYALTDQFYPKTLNHASEQYAFSIMLQKETEILSCETVNYHYWYRIKKAIADEFLEREMTDSFHSLLHQEKLTLVRQWVKVLPGIFETHKLMTKDRAIQAFNTNRFYEGYKWSLRAIAQAPFQSSAFIKDVLYHFKRQLSGNGR